MLKIILQLIDLHSELLLFVCLAINVLIALLKILVVLRVVLLEVSLLFLKLDAGLSELLSQLLYIDCLYAEITSHSQVVIWCACPRPLGVEFHLDL